LSFLILTSVYYQIQTFYKPFIEVKYNIFEAYTLLVANMTIFIGLYYIEIENEVFRLVIFFIIALANIAIWVIAIALLCEGDKCIFFILLFI